VEAERPDAASIRLVGREPVSLLMLAEGGNLLGARSQPGQVAQRVVDCTVPPPVRRSLWADRRGELAECFLDVRGVGDGLRKVDELLQG